MPSSKTRRRKRQQTGELKVAKNKKKAPKKFSDHEALEAINYFLSKVADLDDLAKILSTFVENGPVVVTDEPDGRSSVYVNGTLTSD